MNILALILGKPIRYARHHDLEDWLALGWFYVGVADPRYSSHVVWLCDCKPAVPA